MGIVKLTVDDELTRKLEQLPEARQLAITTELGAHLSSMVQGAWSKSERAERARRIAAMTPGGVVQTDSTLLIREDRDR